MSIHISDLFGINYCVNFSVHAITHRWVHNPFLNFPVQARVDQIASVNVPTMYSKTHYLANRLCNSSCLINSKCEWILRVEINIKCFKLPMTYSAIHKNAGSLATGRSQKAAAWNHPQRLPITAYGTFFSGKVELLNCTSQIMERPGTVRPADL